MPVLLLDDVMSELDTQRRAALLEGMRDAQVFVTCTEADHIDSQLDVLSTADTKRPIFYYHVAAGCVDALGTHPFADRSP